MKVLVADDLSTEGVDILKRAEGVSVDVKVGLKPDELKAIIGEYDALAVRSATKVTADVLEAANRMKVIGRAGVGVDNIDVEAATRKGVVVMNTPGGNTTTVAELAVGMMMAVSRHLPQATASMKAGKWEKKKFKGNELSGKTVGVVGLGNIGRVVVDRCQGLKMKVIAFDPFLSEEAAGELGVELMSVDALLAKADYVSLHVPLNEQTRGMIGKDALAKMKKGAYLINCARGGIVDEEALHEALSSGHLGGAAFDVFVKEPPPADHPLFALDNFVCTPHVGASTEEAQQVVALALAEQMVEYLTVGSIRNALNVPSIPAELREKLGPWLELTHKMGVLAGQLAGEGVTEVEVALGGEVGHHPLRPVAIQALRGLLSAVLEEGVNDVNAPARAKERGIKLVEKRTEAHEAYASSVTLRVKGKRNLEIEGTVFGKRESRIVRVDRFELEAIPEGHLVAMHNKDVPGVVGKLGTIIGDSGVNIGRIHLSRDVERNEAFSLVNLDAAPEASVLEKLRAIEGVMTVSHVSL